MATEAAREQKYTLAVLYYKKSIGIWKDNSDYRMRIALLQRGVEQHEESKENIAKPIQIDPHNAHFHFELAEIHLAQKHYNNAEESHFHALQIKPNWALATEKLAQLKEIVIKKRERESVDMLSHGNAKGYVDPALFHPSRWDLTYVAFINQRQLAD